MPTLPFVKFDCHTSSPIILFLVFPTYPGDTISRSRLRSFRAWRQLHPPAAQHAHCVQRLLDAGAVVVVGKLELEAMIVREEPVRAVEFTDPFNPRGDGYQVPSGSSSGSAAAIGSYGWLDFPIGPDTIFFSHVLIQIQLPTDRASEWERAEACPLQWVSHHPTDDGYYEQRGSCWPVPVGSSPFRICFPPVSSRRAIHWYCFLA